MSRLRPVAWNPVCRVFDSDILAQKMYMYDQACRGGHDYEPESISDAYLKSCEEMGTLFADCPEALERTLEIASLADRYSIGQIPHVSRSLEEVASYFLREETLEAAHAMFGDNIPDGIARRLDLELSHFEDRGSAISIKAFTETVKTAKEYGFIASGGSMTSSMVHHVLGNNPVNPVEHNLFSELYIPGYQDEAEALSVMTECDPTVLVSRMVENIGLDRTARVIRYKGVNRRRLALDCHELDPSLTEEDGRMLYDCIRHNPDAELPPRLSEYAYAIYLLEGCASEWSIAPDMFIVASSNIEYGTPLFRDDESGSFVTLLCDADLTGSGIPYIRVRQTDDAVLIGRVLSLIRKRTGSAPDLHKISFDDSRVFDTLCTGDVRGVHLFSGSNATRNSLRGVIAPGSIRELAVFIAVTDSRRKAILDRYMKNRNDGYAETGTAVDAILCDTCGVMVFFEQFMEILRECAGYELHETSEAVSRLLFHQKPDADLIGIEFDGDLRFGLEHSGLVRSISEEVAENGRLFSTRSTSISDALMSYMMAWLKVYYPDDFSVALMEGDILLESFYPFCRAEDDGVSGDKMLDAPFLMGDYVCASDGHWLLKVHRSLVHGIPAGKKGEIPYVAEMDIEVTRGMLERLDADVNETAGEDILPEDVVVEVGYAGGVAYFHYGIFGRILEAMNLLGCGFARIVTMGERRKTVARYAGIDAEMWVMPMLFEGSVTQKTVRFIIS